MTLMYEMKWLNSKRTCQVKQEQEKKQTNEKREWKSKGAEESDRVDGGKATRNAQFTSMQWRERYCLTRTKQTTWVECTEEKDREWVRERGSCDEKENNN